MIDLAPYRDRLADHCQDISAMCPDAETLPDTVLVRVLRDSESIQHDELTLSQWTCIAPALIALGHVVYSELEHVRYHDVDPCLLVDIEPSACSDYSDIAQAITALI